MDASRLLSPALFLTPLCDRDCQLHIIGLTVMLVRADDIYAKPASDDGNPIGEIFIDNRIASAAMGFCVGKSAPEVRKPLISHVVRRHASRHCVGMGIGEVKGRAKLCLASPMECLAKRIPPPVQFQEGPVHSEAVDPGPRDACGFLGWAIHHDQVRDPVQTFLFRSSRRHSCPQCCRRCPVL